MIHIAFFPVFSLNFHWLLTGGRGSDFSFLVHFFLFLFPPGKGYTQRMCQTDVMETGVVKT